MYTANFPPALPPSPAPSSAPSPAPSPRPAQDPSLRVVLFLTETAHESLPHAAHRAACLLPMAWTTFAERVLQSCALAGLQQVDVVACEHLEDLRHALGHGERWGLQLRWHLVKDGHAPYGVLRALAASAQRVIVGHAHAWIDASALAELVRENRVAVALEPALAWTGWASMPAAAAANLSPHADAQVLAEQVLAPPLTAESQSASGAGRLFPLLAGQHLRAGDAQHLLALQARCLEPQHLQAAPACWISMPWGLCAAEAHVHPSSVITGPVVIGPGCVVEQDTVIGSHSVLYADAMVSRGATVQGSLILKNTYIGTQVSVLNAVVQGGVAHHVDWGVLHELPHADAVLAPLQKESGDSPAAHAQAGRFVGRWCGRVVAAGVAVLAVPALAAAQASSLLQGGRGRCNVMQAVRGRNRDGSLRLTPVRVGGGGQPGIAQAVITRFGAVLDVLQGRRAWFGVRPRSAGDWYALHREWQRLLAQHPIGFFHAPAWVAEESAGCAEARAVADVYFAVTHQGRLARRLFGAGSTLGGAGQG